MSKKHGSIRGRLEVLLYLNIATADFATNPGARSSIKEGQFNNKTFFYKFHCTIKSGRTTLI